MTGYTATNPVLSQEKRAKLLSLLTQKAAADPAAWRVF